MMEEIVWYPRELPAPTAPDFTIALGDGRRFSDNDAGPPSARAGAAVADVVSMVTLLTLTQKMRWLRWRDEEIAGGLDPFLMRAWGRDGAPLARANSARLLSVSGGQFLFTQTWLCMLDRRTVDIRPAEMEWRIAFDVAVLP